MGIEKHGFNFLLSLSRRNELKGRLLTLGRQSLDVNQTYVDLCVGKNVKESNYCEETLLAMGATQVDSIDFSEYEGATYIADLSKPYAHPYQYDMVFDFGTLEHIFDVSTAFRNVISLCKPGGAIVHLLPVNNLNGHGFWQFCSDLLYEVYSERNGFERTEVFYASGLDERYWYKAAPPRPGVRVEIASIEPIVLICKTIKVRNCSSIDAQQSYYSEVWRGGAAQASGGMRRGKFSGKLLTLIRRFPLVYLALRNLHLVLGLIFGFSRYSIKGKQFTKILVSDFVKN